MFGTLFARKLVKLQLAQGENQIIAISEEGVERRSATTVVCHPWSAVSRVDELPLAFLLVSGSTAIGSIEKSGIASDIELHEVRAIISSKKPVRRLSSTFLALRSAAQP